MRAVFINTVLELVKEEKSYVPNAKYDLGSKNVAGIESVFISSALDPVTTSQNAKFITSERF